MEKSCQLTLTATVSNVSPTSKSMRLNILLITCLIRRVSQLRGAVTWAGSVVAVVAFCFGMFIALSTTMHENFQLAKLVGPLLQPLPARLRARLRGTRPASYHRPSTDRNC